MSGKPASHPLLLPRCHFESIKALHPRARVCTHSKQYLHLQINVMEGHLNIKKLGMYIYIPGPT